LKTVAYIPKVYRYIQFIAIQTCIIAMYNLLLHIICYGTSFIAV